MDLHVGGCRCDTGGGPESFEVANHGRSARHDHCSGFSRQTHVERECALVEFIAHFCATPVLGCGRDPAWLNTPSGRPIGSASKTQNLSMKPRLCSPTIDRTLRHELFVVAMNPDVEVQTASLGEAVHLGVIPQLVIEVCEVGTLPVMMSSWQARGAWVESFVTSSLRMVQPVPSMRIG